MEYLDTKHHLIDDTDLQKKAETSKEVPVKAAPKAPPAPYNRHAAKPDKEEKHPNPPVKKTDEKRVGRLREFFSRVSLTEEMMFVDNLSTMLKAGLPLAPALHTLAQETKNKYFKKILAHLEDNVENGQLLSKGMKLYPKVFSEMIIASVEVGENTGMLPETLARLAITLKSQKALKSKVLGALMYPCIVLIALVVVSLVLATMVFPQLVTMFEDAGVKLPFTLVAVRFISNTIRNYYIYILLALVILFILFKIIFKLPKPKLLLHSFLLKMPIAGRIIKDINLTRYASNLHTLLGAGLAIVTSMEIVGKTLGNMKYRLAVLDMAKELEKGEPLDKTMSERSNLFPSLAIQLCQVGAKTGELESILAKIGEYYEDRVTNTLANLSTIIEPVLLLLVGVAVGFIAVSVISPMYQLTLSFAD
ncbi:MAG: hypothetical protein C3F02_03065 [Parcubacteria group bacterium]|nr:MAG: hypothetical protein C3F02_03065 [Parcubacteria group bacterium]